MPDRPLSTPTFTLVGAGPVGALMALRLAQRGERVRLIERRADPRARTPERGRSINLALAARGLLALERTAVMERIAPHLVSMRGRMLHEDRQVRLLPYGIHAHEVLHSISRELLNRLLIEAVAQHPSIELQFDTRCVGVDAHAGTLRLERGAARTELPFRYLLGTDGAGSTVRFALQQQRLLRAREDELSHDYKELQIARADELERHALHIWPRGGYMLIALPNPDESFTATLFVPRCGDPSFERLRTGAAVRNFFQHDFGDVAPLLPDLEHQFEQHPQGRLGTLHCEPWAIGPILLLGDAAHAIVPFHGQGLNCGFEDCMLLDRLLDTHPQAETAFAAFERQRRPDAQAIAQMALENYEEMRAGVRSVQFPLRQRLASELERHFPTRCVPRYSMVMFHPEIGYAEAQRRGARLQRVLEELSARRGLDPLRPEELPLVRTLLDAHAL